MNARRVEMLTEGPTSWERELVRRHFAYLEDLVREGVVLLAGRPWMPDLRTFGIAILRARN